MAVFTELESSLAPLAVDNVDTDQIIPASYLKVTDKSGLGEGLFAGWRRDAEGLARPDFVLNQSSYRGAEILLAGDNFGCGSSREHAPWALLDYGFKAVISTRFADIFRNNSLKNGLLVVTVPASVSAQLFGLVEAKPESRVRIDLNAQELSFSSLDGSAERLHFDIDPFARHCLLNGLDQLAYLLDQQGAIEAWEERHPARVDTLAP